MKTNKGVTCRTSSGMYRELANEHLYENVYSFTLPDKSPRWCTFTLIESKSFNGATTSTIFEHLNSFVGFRKECNGISTAGFVSCVLEINPTGKDSGWYASGFRGGGTSPNELDYRRKQIDTTFNGMNNSPIEIIPAFITCVGRQIQ